MQSTRWINRGEITKAQLQKVIDTYDILPEIAAILTKRGINIEEFQKNTWYKGEMLKDFDKAVTIIIDAIRTHKKICIVNDYDVDGVTSGVIMYKAIQFFGGNSIIITPDREIDGYGISKRIIDTAKDYGAKLIITTDNGIAAREEIGYAKSLGMTVVITDHHEVPFVEENGKKQYILPEADAIIDPKQKDCQYPTEEICGAVVAMKVVYGMITRIKPQKTDNLLYLQHIITELACIGTICDVMPLTGENRTIVKTGLSSLKKYGSSIAGICAIMEIMDITREKISSYSIGFKIGPMLNSTSRITGSANLATELLLENDKNKAFEIAKTLYDLNEERKGLTTQCVEEAHDLVEAQKDNPVYVLYFPNKNPSIMGIVASRIVDETNHPVLCLTDSNGILKGSGRSIEGYDMFYHFSKHKDLYEKFGGHQGAAGISLKKENLNILRNRLNQDATNIPVLKEDKIKYVDLFMGIDRVNVELAEAVEMLEPFGNGNSNPLFCSEKVEIDSVRTLGKDGNYLKISFYKKDKTKIEALLFKKAEDFLNLYEFKSNVFMDILYTIGLNTWNGLTTAQITIEGFKLSE